MGRVVDDPDPRKEIAVDEAKKGDNKDERTRKPDSCCGSNHSGNWIWLCLGAQEKEVSSYQEEV